MDGMGSMYQCGDRGLRLHVGNQHQQLSTSEGASEMGSIGIDH